MTYETVSRLAQQGGTVYFVLMFLGGVLYALWPRNRKGFEQAARLPFDEEL